MRALLVAAVCVFSGCTFDTNTCSAEMPCADGAPCDPSGFCVAVDAGCSEQAKVSYYVDGDGDGFGSSAAGAATEAACSQPAGFAASRNDCDDTKAAVNPSATEVCDSANVDEDCDGTIDEDCACATPGAPQVCCAGRGTQTCEAGASGNTLSACSVIAAPESCNGIDDNCDGQADESFSLTSPDGGPARFDGGVLQLDGGCTVGVGACARSATPSCAGGVLSCPAVAGSPGTESCNGIDDDCDGEVDQASTSLCPISGQLCGGGTCACPQSQSVCGASCQSIGATCEVGTGACLRQGTSVCASGSVSCNATAGTPGAEVCNNIDDDCDGQTDEAGAGLCTVTGQTCGGGVCSCPSGQSVCGTSCQTLGGSCSAGVGACNRAGAMACISGGVACDAVPGSPATEICDGVDNDCDGQTDEGTQVTCLPDGDNDRYATNATTSLHCRDESRVAFGYCPLGYVTQAASLAITDCDPTDPSLYVLRSTHVDADNDTYCVGVGANTCIGQNPPTGRRLTEQCAPSSLDCDDGSASRYVMNFLRDDADGDQYCVNAAVNTCVGATVPAGKRLASSCIGEDCADGNSAATTTCSFRYETAGHTQTCPNGAQTFSLLVVASCPLGFYLAAYGPEKIGLPNAGFCTANSPTSITQTCNGFDGSNCRIGGTCLPN